MAILHKPALRYLPRSGPGPRIRDLEGELIGQLTVVRYLHSDKQGPVWLVRCTCGAEVRKHASDLTRRRPTRACSKSCPVAPRPTRVRGQPKGYAWHTAKRPVVFASTVGVSKGRVFEVLTP